MRNPREFFPLLIPEYSPIPHNPTKNYGLTQKIEPNVCLSSNWKSPCFLLCSCLALVVILDLSNTKKQSGLVCSVFWTFLLSIWCDNTTVGEDIWTKERRLWRVPIVIPRTNCVSQKETSFSESPVRSAGWDSDTSSRISLKYWAKRVRFSQSHRRTHNSPKGNW